MTRSAATRSHWSAAMRDFDCLSIREGVLHVEGVSTLDLAQRFGTPLFVFTDTVLAVVLVAAAILQVTEDPAAASAVLVSGGRPLGESLGLFAAGMLAFLGILDLAYLARTGLFKREHEGLINAGVVTGTLTLSVILVLRFF